MHLAHPLNHDSVCVPLPSLNYDWLPAPNINRLLLNLRLLLFDEFRTRLRLFIRATRNCFIHTRLLFIHQPLNCASASYYLLLLSVYRRSKPQGLTTSVNAIVPVVLAHPREIIQVNPDDAWLKIFNDRHHWHPTYVLVMASERLTFLVRIFCNVFRNVSVAALMFYSESFFLLDHILPFTAYVRLWNYLI